VSTSGCAAQDSVCEQARGYLVRRVWGWIAHCHSASHVFSLGPAECRPVKCDPTLSGDLDQYFMYVLSKVPDDDHGPWKVDYRSLVNSTRAPGVMLSDELAAATQALLVDFILMQLREACIVSDATRTDENLAAISQVMAGDPSRHVPALAAFESMPEIAALGLLALLVLDTAASANVMDIHDIVRAKVQSGQYGRHVSKVLAWWQNNQSCASVTSPSSTPGIPTSCSEALASCTQSQTCGTADEEDHVRSRSTHYLPCQADAARLTGCG